MSEKDFILKKFELEGKLKELKKKKPTSVKRIDDDFLKLASYFLVNNEFLNKRGHPPGNLSTSILKGFNGVCCLPDSYRKRLN